MMRKISAPILLFILNAFLNSTTLATTISINNRFISYYHQ
ncbi:Uncharacterised protein [Legionella pneumophila]|nr:Uncharacterised protein [Legionella pneumophila]